MIAIKGKKQQHSSRVDVESREREMMMKKFSSWRGYEPDSAAAHTPLQAAGAAAAAAAIVEEDNIFFLFIFLPRALQSVTRFSFFFFFAHVDFVVKPKPVKILTD